ncbi:hypothetical protein LTR36_001750 [Oleoguttula mirabilis]|uniref:SH3 domain-containing protein n=1 Tax=Oleoguttula mirabilis TaxID=1507867 RepID=A0AAV9JND7_9PEZI|nr:hypothetical protein LTR36_001750 [Oleoguttula mirabilis]
MKSMQRKFGKLTKRQADQGDVRVVLAEFKAMDDMLDTLIRDLKLWRNGWEDILKLQYDASEAFAALYKPIDPIMPGDEAEMRHAPAQTPAKYVQKCLGLQKLYSALKEDLQQEIGLIDKKLVAPAEEAKAATKSLAKTLKHRENMKLDYERYLSRAEHARRKEMRSMKEEAALAAHEDNLAQALIDYQTADDQIKQCFPPVTDAVVSLMPWLLASQVMLQTTLVGQLYTVLDGYTKRHGMPNPAPSDGAIIDAWEREFTGFRKEVEQGISTIANGKAVGMPMTLPEKDKHGTVTGLGLRNKAGGLTNKAGGLMHRKGSGQSGMGMSLPGGRPMLGSRHASSQESNQETALALRQHPHHDEADEEEEEEEMAPPKPPRPGWACLASPGIMPSPSIPMGSKPRIPSSSSGIASPNGGTAQWERKAAAAAVAHVTSPSWQTHNNAPPPSYDQASPALGGGGGGGTPPSRYQTPMLNGSSPLPEKSAVGHDYFAHAATQRLSQASSLSSFASSTAAAAAKKKPAPPIPAKRFPSGAGPPAQYVTAIYDFEGQNAGDLAFREGERIRVVKKTESVEDWWTGEVGGRVGEFPANYVRV